MQLSLLSSYAVVVEYPAGHHRRALEPEPHRVSTHRDPDEAKGSALGWQSLGALATVVEIAPRSAR